jgi:hypothetical protein
MHLHVRIVHGVCMFVCLQLSDGSVHACALAYKRLVRVCVCVCVCACVQYLCACAYM